MAELRTVIEGGAVSVKDPGVVVNMPFLKWPGCVAPMFDHGSAYQRHRGGWRNLEYRPKEGRRMTDFLKRTGMGLALMLFAATAALADSHVYKLYVDGLACPFCAYGVEKKVGGLDGVEKVEIEIEEGVVTVTLADGATLDEATAKQAIDQAGFSLRKFEAPKKE